MYTKTMYEIDCFTISAKLKISINWLGSDVNF